MSVLEPASLETTANVSPTAPARMAPMSVMSGPGQAMPRASMVFVMAISVSVMSVSPLDECDRAGRRVRHERGDSLDVVDEWVEVIGRDLEELHRQGAGVDLDVADVLRLAEELAPVARSLLARAHETGTARACFRRSAVPRGDLPATECVEGPVLEEDVDRAAHRRGAGGEDRGGPESVVST